MRVEKEGERTTLEPNNPGHLFRSCRRIYFPRMENLSEPIGGGIEF